MKTKSLNTKSVTIQNRMIHKKDFSKQKTGKNDCKLKAMSTACSPQFGND